MSTVNVRYVGLKSRKQDTAAGTGIVWNGPGDVQAVPLKVWPALAKHADVWRLANEQDADSALRSAMADAGLAAVQVQPLQPATVAALEPMLEGTGHPDTITVAEGVSLPREQVVRDAYLALVFGAKEWNELTDDQRAELVDAHIERLRETTPAVSETPADFASIQPQADSAKAEPEAKAPDAPAKPAAEPEAINANSTAPKKTAGKGKKAS